MIVAESMIVEMDLKELALVTLGVANGKIQRKLEIFLNSIGLETHNVVLNFLVNC